MWNDITGKNKLLALCSDLLGKRGSYEVQLPETTRNDCIAVKGRLLLVFRRRQFWSSYLNHPCALKETLWLKCFQWSKCWHPLDRLRLEAVPVHSKRHSALCWSPRLSSIITAVKVIPSLANLRCQSAKAFIKRWSFIKPSYSSERVGFRVGWNSEW